MITIKVNLNDIMEQLNDVVKQASSVTGEKQIEASIIDGQLKFTVRMKNNKKFNRQG